MPEIRDVEGGPVSLTQVAGWWFAKDLVSGWNAGIGRTPEAAIEDARRDGWILHLRERA